MPSICRWMQNPESRSKIPLTSTFHFVLVKHGRKDKQSWLSGADSDAASCIMVYVRDRTDLSVKPITQLIVRNPFLSEGHGAFWLNRRRTLRKAGRRQSDCLNESQKLLIRNAMKRAQLQCCHTPWTNGNRRGNIAAVESIQRLR